MKFLSAQNISAFSGRSNKPHSILNNVNFSLEQGQTLCIVGESGSGKTSLGKILMGLWPPDFQVSGMVSFQTKSSEIELNLQNNTQFSGLRGSVISMVFQDAPGSLNPLFTCGEQIFDIIKTHQPVSAATSRKMAFQLIERVGFVDYVSVCQSYPHQLSGGMAQRVALAMALAGQPEILIADEPTTALDVISKNHYLNLLNELKNNLGLSLVLITHNLDDALRLADSILVMYSGNSIEFRKADEFLTKPFHPYSKALLDIHKSLINNDYPQAIPGESPSVIQSFPGCPYHPRCPRATDECRKTNPLPVLRADGQYVACHHPIE